MDIRYRQMFPDGTIEYDAESPSGFTGTMYGYSARLSDAAKDPDAGMICAPDFEPHDDSIVGMHDRYPPLPKLSDERLQKLFEQIDLFLHSHRSSTDTTSSNPQ